MELSQMICHSFLSHSLCPSCYDSVSFSLSLHRPCAQTHLETHNTRSNCHLPPPLSGSSRLRSPCSASWGVLAGWGGAFDRLSLAWRAGPGTSRSPAGAALPAPEQRLTTGLLTCRIQASVAVAYCNHVSFLLHNVGHATDDASDTAADFVCKS